jgi:hypothetical protein
MSQPYSTLSEKMQVQFNWKKCPNLDKCNKQISHAYFRDVCTKPKYISCLHYAMSINEVDTPLGWLQKLAAHLAIPDVDTEQVIE